MVYFSSQCEKLVDIGVATAYVNGITRIGDFVEKMQMQFKQSIANISNDYVILQVLPKHVLIVDVTITSNDRVVVHYLVVNPSGSTVLPVAFRSHELYLMCKLNDDKIDKMLPYSITPIEPESDYKLAIPPWAIAISCYLGIVAISYITYTIYQANRQFKNINNRMDDYEMQSSMEKGHELRLHIDANDPIQPANEKGTQVRQNQLQTQSSVVEVQVETPTSSNLGENNDEIPPPYASDNSSVAGSSSGSSDVRVKTVPPETDENTEDNKAPQPSPDEDESFPPPPSPEELDTTGVETQGELDTTGLTQGEQEATAALDGIVNDVYEEDDDNLQKTSL
ncbi:uncharacterized protein [Antedon mediterranea]|uniref:uncharacterized protein n=1 Tax=Antedon mediterranea TaxID=105859 RepID=UPI003AF9BE09